MEPLGPPAGVGVQAAEVEREAGCLVMTYNIGFRV